MKGPAFSTTAGIYVLTHEQTARSTALIPPKVWKRFVHVYSILKHTPRKLLPSHQGISSKH